jgi:hypothetical protein
MRLNYAPLRPQIEILQDGTPNISGPQNFPKTPNTVHRPYHLRRLLAAIGQKLWSHHQKSGTTYLSEVSYEGANTKGRSAFVRHSLVILRCRLCDLTHTLRSSLLLQLLAYLFYSCYYLHLG